MAAQPMPPANADIATAWAFLEEGVDHIMTRQDVDLSYERFWALYTVQYNYCTSPSPSESRASTGRSGANLIGYNLYDSLVCYFAQHLQRLRDVRHFVHDDRMTMNTSCSIRIRCKTSFSWAIMPPSGTDIQQERTTSTVYSTI